MSEAIGIRLDEDFLKKIEELSKEEVSDRSTTIRKLIYAGYNNLIKKKVAEEYKKGNISMSEAAKKAQITIWEMEQYLIENGYKSSYSIEDLKSELKLLSD
jgi:predicted HTH domain antitoxin